MRGRLPEECHREGPENSELCDTEIFRPPNRNSAWDERQARANAEAVLFAGDLLALKGISE